MFSHYVFKTLFFPLFFPLMIILLISGCGSSQSTHEEEQTEIASNNQPIANAGIDQKATVGETILLDASASRDSDGDAIGFSWSLITIPDGSNAILIDPGNTDPSFVADLEGDYVVSLVVNDGSLDSATDTVAVFVSPATATTTLSDGLVIETAALLVIGDLIYHDTNLSTPIGQSCASCHDLSTGFDDPNSSNPTSVGADGVNFGTRNNGQFRTPNLRNIAITASYMHNGVFNTLEEVVDFYNTRDSGFPDAPEVDQNIDQGGQIGELNLTPDEITDLIAFLNTFTDR